MPKSSLFNRPNKKIKRRNISAALLLLECSVAATASPAVCAKARAVQSCVIRIRVLHRRSANCRYVACAASKASAAVRRNRLICTTAETTVSNRLRHVYFVRPQIALPYAANKAAVNTTVGDDYVNIPLTVVANTLYPPTRCISAKIRGNGASLTIIAHSISSPSCVFEANLIIYRMRARIIW